MNDQKNLTIHTLPIVVLSIGVFIAGLSASFILGTSTSNPHAYLNTVGSALTSDSLQIKSYKNGLASISLSDQKTVQKSQTSSESVVSSGEDLTNAVILNLETSQAVTSLSSGNK